MGSILQTCAACFALLILAQGLPLAAQQIPSAVVADPARDAAHPARMEAPDIYSHGKKLYAIFYLASGEAPHPTVLLMHGFPGNEQNLDLAQAIRRAGWNVLFPHYRGSWGSEGSFSFSNSIEDTQTAIQFLRDPANVKKYGIDTKKIVLIGHSMGGFMVAYAAAHDPAVAGVVMISAWNIGAEFSKPLNKNRIDSFRDNASRLVGTTADELMAEATQNASKWNFSDYAPEMKDRPVLILDSDDGLAPVDQAMAAALRKAGNAQVTETHTATDHGYADHRIALEAAVVSWLQNLPAEPHP
jgi:uncharacterized protein